MRKLVLIWMLWIASITVYPQINLKLVNQEDQPITGAVLECDNGFNAVSDQEGVITVEENTGKCLIRHVAYESVEVNIGIASDKIILKDHSRVLPDLVVYGYQEPVQLSEAPGGYSYLDGKDFEKFSAVTPVTAFNSLPGVRMEQRSPSSYRINIRGSTLRSPFGVRNVKVYWNRIPITEPTGSTPLNMLDMAQFSNVQIIRGPSGSIYGAGTGGVLLMDNDLPSVSGLRGNASISLGSFNMFRADAGIQHQGDNHSLQVSVSNHQSKGYREQSEFNRSNFNVSGQYRFNEQEGITYHVLYGDLFYQD
jgi:iron complex outermembrane receptor protein